MFTPDWPRRQVDYHNDQDRHHPDCHDRPRRRYGDGRAGGAGGASGLVGQGGAGGGGGDGNTASPVNFGLGGGGGAGGAGGSLFGGGGGGGAGGDGCQYRIHAKHSVTTDTKTTRKTVYATGRTWAKK